MKKKYINIVGIFILIATLFLTIGYAAFVDTLSISNSNVAVRPERFTRISAVTTSSGYISDLNYNMTAITGVASIPANESVSFETTITTYSSVPAALSAISVSDGNNTLTNVTITPDLTNTYIKICNTNNECTLNASKAVTITITNNTGSAINTKNFSVNLTFTPFYTITYNQSVVGDVLEGNTFQYTVPSNITTVTKDSGTGTLDTSNLPNISVNNVQSDIVLTGTTSSNQNISPEAQQIIDQSEPGDTIQVTTTANDTSNIIGSSGNTVTTGYDATVGKYYLLSTDYTGKYTSGNTNRPALQETFNIENLSWTVWDKYDNKLILISTNPTTDKLSLVERVGYTNGLYFMNSVVDSLYGGSTGVTGRNFKMTDIEKKIMEYLDSQSGQHTYTDSSGQAIMSESNLIALRTQIDSTYASSNYTMSASRYRNIPICHGTDSTVNFYTNTSIRKLEDVESNVPTTSNGTTRNSVVGTKLFYSATSLTNYLPTSDIDIINSNGTSYWIATRVINATSISTLTFGFRRSNGTGGVTNAFIANSGNGAPSVATYPLRPVLEIDLEQANISVVNGKLTFG